MRMSYCDSIINYKHEHTKGLRNNCRALLTCSVTYSGLVPDGEIFEWFSYINLLERSKLNETTSITTKQVNYIFGYSFTGKSSVFIVHSCLKTVA